VDIREAASKAADQRMKMRRTSWPKGLHVEPTNRPMIDCIISHPEKNPGKMWAPSLNDLIALDWEVTVY